MTTDSNVTLALRVEALTSLLGEDTVRKREQELLNKRLKIAQEDADASAARALKAGGVERAAGDAIHPMDLVVCTIKWSDGLESRCIMAEKWFPPKESALRVGDSFPLPHAPLEPQPLATVSRAIHGGKV